MNQANKQGRQDIVRGSLDNNKKGHIIVVDLQVIVCMCDLECWDLMHYLCIGLLVMFVVIDMGFPNLTMVYNLAFA